MRDRRNALIWAVGMWFLRRTLRRRATAGAAATREGGKLGLVVKLAAVGGIGYAAWRKFRAPSSPDA